MDDELPVQGSSKKKSSFKKSEYSRQVVLNELMKGILKDPKKTRYSYLECGLGLERVNVIYLEDT